MHIIVFTLEASTSSVTYFDTENIGET